MISIASLCMHERFRKAKKNILKTFFAKTSLPFSLDVRSGGGESLRGGRQLFGGFYPAQVQVGVPVVGVPLGVATNPLRAAVEPQVAIPVIAPAPVRPSSCQTDSGR